MLRGIVRLNMAFEESGDVGRYVSYRLFLKYNIVIASAGRSNPYTRLQVFCNDEWIAAVATTPSQVTVLFYMVY